MQQAPIKNLIQLCWANPDRNLSEKIIRRRREGPIESQEHLQELENWVAEQISADSVIYNSLDIFVAALGIGKENLCTKCWDGISPVRG